MRPFLTAVDLAIARNEQSAPFPTFNLDQTVEAHVIDRIKGLEVKIEELTKQLAEKEAGEPIVQEHATLRVDKLTHKTTVIERSVHVKTRSGYYRKFVIAEKEPERPKWEIDPEVEKEFEELAEKCYQATKYSSFHKDVVNNKYYKQIIGLEGGTPILFREFQSDPLYWYDALSNKTRHEIQNTEGLTTEEFVGKWIEWGKEKGFIKE